MSSTFVRHQINHMRPMQRIPKKVEKRQKQYNMRLGSKRDSFLFNEEDQVIPPHVKHVTILVKSIPAKAFRSHAALETVNITEEVETIGVSAFENCTKLNRIKFASGSDSKLRTVKSEAFYSCAALSEIIFPAGVQTLGNQVFQNCRALKHVHLPDSLQKMGVDIFRACSSLTVMEIPPRVKEIPHSAFFNCPKLSAVYLPPGLQVIGENALFMCSSLTILEIPASVTSIGKTSFYRCEALKEKTDDGDVVELCKNRFNDLPLHRLLYQRHSKVNASRTLTKYLSHKFYSRRQKIDALHTTDVFGMTAFDIIADLSNFDTKIGLRSVSAWFDSLEDVEIKEEEEKSTPVFDHLTEEEKHNTFGRLAVYVSEYEATAAGDTASMTSKSTSKSISALEDKKAELVSLVSKATSMIKNLDEQISSGASSEYAPSMMSSSVDTESIDSPRIEDDFVEEDNIEEYDDDDVVDSVVEDSIVEDEDSVSNEIESLATVEEELVEEEPVEEEPEVPVEDVVVEEVAAPIEYDPLNSNDHEYVEYQVGEEGDREMWTDGGKPEKKAAVATKILKVTKALEATKAPEEAKTIQFEEPSEETKKEEKAQKKKKKKKTKSMVDRFGDFPLYGNLKTKLAKSKREQDDSSMVPLTDEDPMAQFKEESKPSSKPSSKKKKVKFDPFGNYVKSSKSKARRSEYL